MTLDKPPTEKAPEDEYSQYDGGRDATEWINPPKPKKFTAEPGYDAKEHQQQVLLKRLKDLDKGPQTIGSGVDIEGETKPFEGEIEFPEDESGNSKKGLLSRLRDNH